MATSGAETGGEEELAWGVETGARERANDFVSRSDKGTRNANFMHSRALAWTFHRSARMSSIWDVEVNIMTDRDKNNSGESDKNRSGMSGSSGGSNPSQGGQSGSQGGFSGSKGAADGSTGGLSGS